MSLFYPRIIIPFFALFLFLLPLQLYSETGETDQQPPLKPVAVRTVAPFIPTFKLSGEILSEDTTLGGNVLISRHITVAPQATLTFSPGTVVRFAEGAGILVLGRLVAKGNAAAPITLTSIFEQPASGDWQGVTLIASAKKNIFESVNFSGTQTAIYARGATFEFKGGGIDNSFVGVDVADSIIKLRILDFKNVASAVYSVKSEADLSNLLIDGCETAITLIWSSLTAERLKILSSTRAAIMAESSRVKISRSIFSANRDALIFASTDGSLSGSRFIANLESAIRTANSSVNISDNFITGGTVGIRLEDSRGAVWGNSISGSKSYDILYLGEEHFFIGGNWFGSVDDVKVASRLFSRKAGMLEFHPLLASDPLTAADTGF